MKKQAPQEPSRWPEKAYKNLPFLNSRDARTIRVLCEFIEPQTRFRRFRVKDTVVFFGSARIPSPEEAEAEVHALKHAAPSAPVGHETALDTAERDLRLAAYYRDAADLAERMTRWSDSLPSPAHRFLVCSGGGPGIMEAANRGAHRAGGKSVSLNISLPMEQVPNVYQTRGLAFEFHYFFIRKFWFVYLAKALIVFPGGFGTMDELFEVLTLIQTKKTAKQMPVVIYGSEYWKRVINFEAMVEWGMISREDLGLFRFCDSVDEAFDYLKAELTRLWLK